jgi:hypothetical protein
MLHYVEYQLTDHGFHVAALDGPGEIYGLDNRVVDDDGYEDDQRFWHIPVEGYPDGALCCLDAPGLKKTKTLAIFEDGTELPQGGTEIPAAEVVALLEADYGWPAGSRLVGGMPMGPERGE